jgi:DNA-binding transcriptional MocR family regulator
MSAGDLGVVPLAAYVQSGEPRPGLVVGYGAATPDQIERGIAAMAARIT